jgi:methionine-rich copper-binding protein CopC
MNTSCLRGNPDFQTSFRIAMSRVISVIAVSVILLPSMASAHAFLDRAEPKVGSDVSKSPTEVRIWFTQRPEHAFSTIKVLNGDGKQVDKNDTRTDPDDSKALVVSLPNLPPGTYKVVWKVLSVDTHRTQGDFKFTIKP